MSLRPRQIALCKIGGGDKIVVQGEDTLYNNAIYHTP
jgi:hypothetical protein